ncbi:hypothetical protein ACPESV_22660 [Streptomyces umbrinus]
MVSHTNTLLPIRALGERAAHIARWAECHLGGYFVAMEQPELRCLARR